jgi:hypothetical protein
MLQIASLESSLRLSQRAVGEAEEECAVLQEALRRLQRDAQRTADALQDAAEDNQR